MIYDANEFAGFVKNIFPDVLTVIGGPHASALPGETLEEFEYFDVSVKGEGEFILPEIINQIREGNSLEKICGISFRSDNSVVVNPECPPIQDVDSLPFPAWDLFPPSQNYDFMTQRGCPGRCKFCQSGRRNMRVRSPEK